MKRVSWSTEAGRLRPRVPVIISIGLHRMRTRGGPTEHLANAFVSIERVVDFSWHAADGLFGST